MKAVYSLRKLTAPAVATCAVLALAACASAAPGPVEIDVSLQDKELIPGTIQVSQDDTVTLKVQSDAEGSLHLHGYDVEKEVTPGEVTEFVFVADATGRYRLAFHPASGAGGGHHHGSSGTASGHHGSTGSDTAAGHGGSGDQPGAGSPGVVELDSPVSVSVAAEPDANGGVNVQITTEGWRWASERAGGENATPGGHAHIYVGDERIAHIYEPRYYLEGLSPGMHRIRVTLNYDNHIDLTYNGKTIESTTMVTIDKRHAGAGSADSPGDTGDATVEAEYDVGYLEVLPR